MRVVDINCDMGESFGRWSLGDDVAMMPHVTSVNVAAGFHAGDPSTIRRTIEAAADHDLDIGVHVGLPDLLGFGRRTMEVDPDELGDYVRYQVGAVQAFAVAAGRPATHVKPHGALYAMAGKSAAVAAAIAAATADAIPVLLLPRDPDGTAAAAGAHVVAEGFPDLHYRADGTLVLERTKEAWDPALVAARAVRMVVEGRVESHDGSDVALAVQTLCIHGDAPNAPSIAAAVRHALEQAGVAVRPLHELDHVHRSEEGQQ
jgi:UPF0271 protein